MKTFFELFETIYSAKVSGENSFTSQVSGRGNSSAIAAINDKGEFGFLDQLDGRQDIKPYTPVGGRKVLISVKDILNFRPFDWGETITIKRGRKL